MLRGMPIIVLTYFLGMLVAVIPLPEALGVWRPLCVPMTVIYWVMALPHRHGIWEAFAVGIAMDALLGAAIGQHAFAYVLLAYTTRAFYQQFRVFPRVQMVVVVFILLAAVLGIQYGIDRLLGRVDAVPLQYWLPLVSSALLWSPVFLLLRRVRRAFGIA